MKFTDYPRDLQRIVELTPEGWPGGGVNATSLYKDVPQFASAFAILDHEFHRDFYEECRAQWLAEKAEVDCRDTLEARPVELQYDPDDVAFKFDESEVEGTVLFNGEIGGEWRGDGLPPVGTKCLIKEDDGLYHETRIVAIDGYVAIYTNPFFGNVGNRIKYGWTSDYRLFRPLQSERDKATDAMIAVIADDFVGSANDARKACRALYDAGYRKTGGGECKN